jgi:sterol desaturase/sphingolipid hydroxylase (fatty acid hydroxylase superfamily)
MALSLILFLGLDLEILINSPNLLPFWIGMLVVMIIFICFYYYENSKLKKKYKNSRSNADVWLLVLNLIRNLVFLLNFIPLIQLLGIYALVLGIIPYLIIYGLAIAIRAKSTIALI